MNWFLRFVGHKSEVNCRKKDLNSNDLGLAIMNIDLNIGVGKYRDLTKKELNELNQLLAESEKHID